MQLSIDLKIMIKEFIMPEKLNSIKSNKQKYLSFMFRDECE